MRTVIILRGLPGSGKSSIVKFFEPCGYVSMDLFWTRGSTEYKFDYTKLGEAVEWTHKQFTSLLDEFTHHTVVVDNISYKKEHFQFFLDEAKKRDCRIHILHVERPLNELSSVHGVPFETITRQAEQWERYL